MINRLVGPGARRGATINRAPLVRASVSWSGVLCFAIAAGVFAVVGDVIWGRYVGIALAAYVVLIGGVSVILGARARDAAESMDLPGPSGGSGSDKDPPPGA